MSIGERGPSVLLIGTLTDSERQHMIAPLDEQSQWQHSGSIEHALTLLQAADQPPDLILLAQHRPGEIAAASIRQLQVICPLSGIVVIYGSWCEGETRTGKPWPGVLRCAWHEWPLRWREECRRRTAGLIPLWSLPATASVEERLLARIGNGAANIDGPIMLVCQNRDSFSTLFDALRSAGIEAVQDANSPVAVVWETTPASASQPQHVQEITTRTGGAPIIALVTFPRPHDLEQMHAAGIHSVLAKPFLLGELLAEIEVAAAPQNSGARRAGHPSQ